MKKCKSCKQLFMPTKTTQVVCSLPCALKVMPELNRLKRNKEQKEQKKKLKESVKTISDYRKELQYHINMICRKIDYGQPCISSGREFKETNQAGHFYPTSTQGSIRFNLWNVHGQSVADNMYKSGNNQGYTKGLKEVYGEDIYFYILDMPIQFKDVKLDINDLKTAIKKASAINKGLEYKIRPTDERVRLRKEFNLTIGIY